MKNIKLGCPLVTIKQRAPTCPPAENRRLDQMSETTTAQTPKAGSVCALLCLSSPGHAPAREKAGGTQVGQQCQGELKEFGAPRVAGICKALLCVGEKDGKEEWLKTQ